MKAVRKTLLVDNYDSFSYNLVHLVEKITHSKVTVFCNDKIDLDQVSVYDKIILSPGPGIPSEAGLLIPLIKTYASSKSILGVCLGHQAIAEAFGARLINLKTVFHGVGTPIRILDREDGLPPTLVIKSVDEQNNIMGLKHSQYDVQGIQFHPESILTPCGEMILRNWLNY